MTRWGYLSMAFSRSAFAIICLTSVFAAHRVSHEISLMEMVYRFVLPPMFVGAAFLAGAQWAGMVRRGERWRMGEEFIGTSRLALTVFTLTAAFLTALIASAVWRWEIPPPPMSCFMASCPLLWLGAAFGWKHQREQQAIERTMNELAQTLANVADEKARRESAAQRGTNATIGGVSRRASWAHWWTDAGTRDAVQEKQENARR